MLERFIVDMKLAELRRQRDRLLATYDRLSALDTPEDGERLRQLVDGLRNLKFANRYLHPEVASLDVLNHPIGHDPAVVAFWLDRLAQEIAYGRQRAEAVYVFGGLLEEWVRPPAAAPAPDPTDRAPDLLAPFTQTPTLGDYATLLEPFLAALVWEQDQDTRARSMVQPHDLAEVLEHIQDDPYRAPDVRAQASQLSGNDAWTREFADALTIMLETLDDWSYPAGGLPVRAEWAQSKWRLFLNEDLPTACLLELLGIRWRDTIAYLFFDGTYRKPVKIPRQTMLRELDAPQAMIDAADDASPFIAILDLWADETAGDPLIDPEDFNYAYGSINAARVSRLGTLQSQMGLSAYGGNSTLTPIEHALSFIHAEIQVARAAFPDQPFYVIKIDLQDFAPTLPHAVINHIFERVGLPETDRRFFHNYMQMRLRHGDRVIEATQQGIPNAHILSLILGESLLRLLDAYVQSVTHVMVIRVLDDLCLLAPTEEKAVLGWRAVQHFCDVCGLTINRAKSGAVAIGGDVTTGLTDVLPSTPPTWQFLQLNAAGQWQLAEPIFNDFLAETEAAIDATPAMLAKAAAYNNALQYALHSLAAMNVMDDAHRAIVGDALARLHVLADGIIRTMQARHPAAHLPMGWYFFPVTAGGLGLQHAQLYASVIALEAQQQHNTSETPPSLTDLDEWTSGDIWWGNFHGNARFLAMGPPEKTAALQTLVNDFIKRGAKLTGGRQTSLSNYWQWVLYFFGPQILARFGTFRFLIEELAPLQLLTQVRVGDTSGRDSGDLPELT